MEGGDPRVPQVGERLRTPVASHRPFRNAAPERPPYLAPVTGPVDVRRDYAGDDQAHGHDAHPGQDLEPHRTALARAKPLLSCPVKVTGPRPLPSRLRGRLPPGRGHARLGRKRRGPAGLSSGALAPSHPRIPALPHSRSPLRAAHFAPTGGRARDVQ